MGVVTIANISTRAMLEVCASRGVNIPDLLADTRINQQVIDQPGARMAFDQVLSLWAEARQRTGHDGLALDSARRLPFGAYRVLDYLAMTSATPRDGLKAAARYFYLVSGAFELLLRSHRDQVFVELGDGMALDGLPGLYEEYILATLFLRFRFTSGVNWTPREVHLSSPDPAQCAEHYHLFQAPIRFNQPTNRLVVDRSVIDLAQPNADPVLCETLNHHAQQLLNGLPADQSFVQQVRQVLQEGFQRGPVSLSATARALAISPRALQRHLNQNGTSFRAVLDQMRYERTLDLLKAPQPDISEIAFRLRFSEPRAFYRAFKRWTGKTPHEYLRARR